MKNKECAIVSKDLPRLRKKLSKRVKKVRKAWFRLESQATALDSGRCELIDALTPGHRQAFPPPIFHGRQPFDPVSASVLGVADPISLTRHRRVRVLGGCNFLLHGRVAVHPDFYVPKRDRSPLELYGNSRFDEEFLRIRIPMGLSVGKIPRAINLCDQTPHNYAHWLMEIVPKLALLDERLEWNGWPVLVDAGIGANQMESIRAVYPSVSEIICLRSYEYLHVDELINVSPTAYCPHEFRDFHAAQRSGFQFFFSGWSLERLRERLRQTYSRYGGGRPRWLYLKRTPLWTYNNRNIQNIDELEDLLDARGIELLNVTGMTLGQQAKLFMNAELIVAPTGAALANMIFAPPGCHIIVLSAAYDGATYEYFHQIAYLLGHKLSFVIGPQLEDDDYHMNRDYIVELSDLKLALDRVLADMVIGGRKV